MSPVMFVINKRFAVLSLPNLRPGVLFSWKAGKSADWGKGDKFFSPRLPNQKGKKDRLITSYLLPDSAVLSARNAWYRLVRSCERSLRGGERKRKRL